LPFLFVERVFLPQTADAFKLLFRQKHGRRLFGQAAKDPFCGLTAPKPRRYVPREMKTMNPILCAAAVSLLKRLFILPG
jgi:hypothetical protein